MNRRGTDFFPRPERRLRALPARTQAHLPGAIVWLGVLLIIAGALWSIRVWQAHPLVADPIVPGLLGSVGGVYGPSTPGFPA